MDSGQYAHTPNIIRHGTAARGLRRTSFGERHEPRVAPDVERVPRRSVLRAPEARHGHPARSEPRRDRTAATVERAVHAPRDDDRARARDGPRDRALVPRTDRIRRDARLVPFAEGRSAEAARGGACLL